MLSRILSRKYVNGVCKRMLNQNIMSQIKVPQTFDTSLRDGIQYLNHNNISLEIKESIYDKIIREYAPESIEIGSLTSPKILPIMKDTLEMHSYAENIQKKNNGPTRSNTYVLIPSFNKLQTALDAGVYNFSFITSASNEFQKKNVNRTIEDTKREFYNIFDILKYKTNYKTKLYISCIDHCPIVGKIDKEFIVKELLYYNTNYNFDEICLSDTCGNLSFENFMCIVENATYLGVPTSKISLHLHISNENMENSKKILKYCFENEINKFDISTLATGGCSITIENKKLLSNLSYGVFYSILYEYIYEKINI